MTSPLELLAGYGARRGALAEWDEAGVEMLAPRALAAALDVPEHARFTSQRDRDDGIWVGFGSPALARVIDAATTDVPWTQLKWRSPMPVRESAARAAIDRLCLRNAVFDVRSVTSGSAVRLELHARYAAVTDDRREGVVATTVSVGNGSLVPEFGPAVAAFGHLEAHALRLDAGAAAAAARAALRALRHQAVDACEGFLDSFRRRQERDRARIEAHFSALARELGRRRTRVSAEVRASRREAIARDRTAKLRELEVRGQVRLDLHPIAAVVVEAPVVRVVVRARRRKAERHLEIEYDVATGALAAPACGGCGRGAAAPALCDGELHVMCAECVSNAAGRWPCPACRHRARA